MQLVAAANLPPIPNPSTSCQVVWRWILFSKPDILGKDLIQFLEAVLLREAGEVQRVNYVRIELEEGVGGQIVNRIDDRLGRHRK